jgi:hypothetical protein
MGCGMQGGEERLHRLKKGQYSADKVIMPGSEG